MAFCFIYYSAFTRLYFIGCFGSPLKWAATCDYIKRNFSVVSFFYRKGLYGYHVGIAYKPH